LFSSQFCQEILTSTLFCLVKKSLQKPFYAIFTMKPNVRPVKQISINSVAAMPVSEMCHCSMLGEGHTDEIEAEESTLHLWGNKSG
jgi:hypothetical protein